MHYRKVTPEEKLYIQRMQSLAFNTSFDEKQIRKQIEKGEYSSEDTYGAIDETGVVLAGMDAIPFTMWFDGGKVSMTGIGGVVSAPESRRRGHIKGIFRRVMADAYENGVVFSHLYPFSHDYYRRFGYEHVGASIKYELPIAPARKLRQTGSVSEFISDSATCELRQNLIDIYETFASRHNVMISRSEELWNSILDIKFFGGDRLYYWSDTESKPNAWVKFGKTANELTISDIAWTDSKAMLGILQFLGMYEDSVEKIVITAGPEFAAELYWSDLYDVKAESMNWLGMNRIVNVQRALQLLNKPDRHGSVVIKVHDDFAEWNNKSYLIEYGDGKGIVTETDSEPDAEITQRVLTQLVLGVYQPDLVLQGSGVSLYGFADRLCDLFPKKKVFIRDSF